MLDRCLAAVTKLDYDWFDVLVVDNAPSDDRTREVAARWGVGYLVEAVPGLSRARNRGAQVCKSEIVAYIDDDAVPERNWLTALLREFRDPRVMAVTGQACALRVNTEAERLFAAMGGFDHGAERMVVDRTAGRWFELANFGGLGDGYNMAFRRRVFDSWPGFHESLGRGAALGAGEEHYAFFSLIDRGHVVVYAPAAVIRHPYPATVDELWSRYFDQLTQSTAYLSFVFIEQPHYRWAIVKFIAEAILGKRRTWRHQPAQSTVRLPQLSKRLYAYLQGPIRYLQSRMGEASSRGDSQASVPLDERAE